MIPDITRHWCARPLDQAHRRWQVQQGDPRITYVWEGAWFDTWRKAMDHANREAAAQARWDGTGRVVDEKVRHEALYGVATCLECATASAGFVQMKTGLPAGPFKPYPGSDR